MKHIVNIKKKASEKLDKEATRKLLDEFQYSWYKKEEKIERYELTKYPLFHMTEQTANSIYSYPAVMVIYTDSKECYQTTFNRKEQSGTITYKDEGESFIIAITKKPAMFGEQTEVFIPIVIEYNPKEVW